jgi:leucyl aminopeptidase
MIQYNATHLSTAIASSEALITFAAGKKLVSQNQAPSSDIQLLLKEALDSGALTEKAGDVIQLHCLQGEKAQLQKIICVQLGKSAKLGHEAKSLRTAAQSVARASKSVNGKVCVIADGISCSDFKSATDNARWLGQQFATAIEKAIYIYNTTKPSEKSKTRLKKLTFIANKAQTRAMNEGLKTGRGLGQGINLARELGNLPGNHCTPSDLAQKAQALAKQYPKLSVKVLNQKAMERLKMGSLLSVARGSAEEPKLIVFEYKGSNEKSPHVIVGKGITFDTGGISLKPGAAMDEMKFDMCGAASVFGCMQALCALDVKKHVVGVVAAAENMPSSTATKPGDVVTSMSGQTIEILNTDAEGRLVLCDALTYVERFEPKSVIDIATLTGACIIALGSHTNGLMSNNQALAEKILAAAKSSGDLTWQLPLFDEYQASLKSNFADMANIGGREAGTITAACFLSRFAKKFAWAHLDIAGTAWKSGAQKGATGRPVELLFEYLSQQAK